MAAVTICSDFRAQEEENPSLLPDFALLFAMKWWDLDAMILVSLTFNFMLAFSPSFITLIKRLFSSFLLSAIQVVSSTYLRLISPAILTPACNPSSPAFHMMCSVYKLNKQGDNKQPCHTPVSILNQSVVPYRVLMVASWPAYRFLRRQVKMVWYFHLFKSFPQFVMIHTV